MALSTGARLGVYEITAQIGMGGMGEVYRATDTKLKRPVAVKIIPSFLAADPDRLARFQREAEVLASLNHPHIGAIYGLEDASGVRALIMEFVEGEDLSQRIARGAIPIDETAVIARQIAEGLEAAHEQGIVHRDLKPANVRVRTDGTVKVLDFGVAKALDPKAMSSVSATLSPTMSMGATEAGIILGTAAYMSPEQARAKPVDQRADIWAFGCVLFEMLTGKPVFVGDTVTDTLAAVLRAEPSWKELPNNVPASVRRLLRRCLQKDPRHRLQHIGDARLELEDADAGEVDPPASVHRTRRRRWWLLVAAVAAAAIAGATGWMWRPLPEAKVVRRYTIPFPAALVGSPGNLFEIALSPDGRTLVYATSSSGLLMRRTDKLVFEPVRGAEGGVTPFFSPNGAWIGFRAGGKLKRISTTGGLAIDICDAPDAQGKATWSDDGSIIVAARGALYKVPFTGGTLEPIVMPDADGAFGQPYALPGSKVVLVRRGDLAVGRIEAIELATLRRHSLLDGTTPQVTASGDLVFELRGTLWAAKFDPTRLSIAGPPVPVVDSIRLGPNAALFSTASDGSLVYVAGAADSNRSLVWLDRTGKTTAALEMRANFQAPRLSPNGKGVVVSVADASGLGLWWYEFERGGRQRLTTSGESRRAVWSPDGNQVAFYSRLQRGTDQDLYTIPATGGEPKLLLERPGLQYPDTWSRDGLVFEEAPSGGVQRDLWLLPTNGTARPLHATQFHERGAVFSPNGRWLAFVSDQPGRAEVFLEAFPGPSRPVPISTKGGIQPVWSRDGKELFYREGDNLMVVVVEADPFRVSPSRKLFDLPGATYNSDPNFADYDVAADHRFLASRAESPQNDEIQVVLNWVEDVRRELGR